MTSPEACCQIELAILPLTRLSFYLTGERGVGPAGCRVRLLHRHGRHLQHVIDFQPGGHQHRSVGLLSLLTSLAFYVANTVLNPAIFCAPSHVFCHSL